MKRAGRPPLPPERQPIKTSVKLSPEVYDGLCAIARRREESLHALMIHVLERAVAVSTKMALQAQPPHPDGGSS